MRAALCSAAVIPAGLIAPQIRAADQCRRAVMAGAFLARSRFRNPLLGAAVPQRLGRISHSLHLTHRRVLELATRSFGPLGGVASIPAIFIVASRRRRPPMPKAASLSASPRRASAHDRAARRPMCRR
jgi:peptidoglycan/LPS O-acetylase OafA/YrhL